MKTAFALLLLTSLSASAAITISGTAATNLRDSSGTASIPAGSLVLLIADGGNGFFNFGANPVDGTNYTSTFDPSITPANANLTVGSTFGGETILGRISSGSGSVSGLLSNISVSNYLNQSFAIVWFSGLAAAGSETTAANGTQWGILRGSDWVLPASDSGTFTTSSTDANGAASYYQVNGNAPTAGAYEFRTATGLLLTSTGGAVFTIGTIPEPSSMMLGAIGALGLLRRRR